MEIERNNKNDELNESLRFDAAYQPLAEGVSRSLDCHKTYLNNNTLLCGPPGSGKSRSGVIPIILSAVGSMVISDPKGGLYKQYKAYLKGKGYDVKRISLINPELSVNYNPLAFVRSSSEIKTLAHIITYTKPYKSSHIDPFWDQTTELLLASLISLVIEDDGIKKANKNIYTVMKLLEELSADEDNIEDCKLSERMREHSIKMLRKGKSSFAVRQYNKFLQTPTKTICTILTTAHAALGVFDTDELLEMVSENKLDIEAIGKKKTAVFVEISDTDRSMDGIASILYSQMFNILCKSADNEPNGEVKVPIRFILDDFATNVKIPDFDSILSNIRARKISAVLAIQSESQLVKQFPDNYETIIEDCDTIIYYGVNSLNSASCLAERADIPVKQALLMKPGTCWIFQHGAEPQLCKTIDLDKYVKENNIRL